MTEQNKEGWVEIDVTDATPTEDPNLATVEVVEEPKAPVPETPEPTPQDEVPKADDEQATAKKRERAETRIRALSTKLREEQRQRDEREAALLKEIEELKQRDHAAQKVVVSTHKAALEARVKTAEDALAKAYNEADPAQIVAATRELSRVSVALERAELDEKTLPEAPKPQARQAAKQEAPEALTAWVEENPWFVEGPKQDKRAALLAAQIGDELTKKGYSLDDPALYEELDKQLAEELPRLKQKPVVATPSRAAAPTASARRPGVVRLTAEEVEMAKFFGMTPQEFAREKQRQGTAENGYTPIGDGK